MWWGARCNGNALYIPHTTTAQYFTSHHISGTAHHTTSHHIFNTTRSHGIWCDVECFAMPDVGCCDLFILTWLWCGIRCDVEYARYGAMLYVMPVMQCHGWGVKCGDAMWNLVVCCDARCGMCLWNTEWCGMVWRILNMAVWCGITVEMQCGMCAVGSL